MFLGKTRPISANLGLNFNTDFLIPQFKSLFQLTFSILFRACNQQIVDKKNYTDTDKADFTLTLGLVLTQDQDYEHLPVK